MTKMTRINIDRYNTTIFFYFKIISYIYSIRSVNPKRSGQKGHCTVFKQVTKKPMVIVKVL